MRQIILAFISVLFFVSCVKDPAVKLPEADFTFVLRNPGILPDTVDFVSLARGAESVKWDFGNGTTATSATASTVYTQVGSYPVKLIAFNPGGIDTVTKIVDIKVDKPVLDFEITAGNPEQLPITITLKNKSIGYPNQYSWTFGDGKISTEQNPVFQYSTGGVYNITLFANQGARKDSIKKEIRISPYFQNYVSYKGEKMNLLAWEGRYVTLLYINNSIGYNDRPTMFFWLNGLDTAYAFYRACTGREPDIDTARYINNRYIMADQWLPVSCNMWGMCSKYGMTGLEMDRYLYEFAYRDATKRSHILHLFLEMAKTFWFYSPKLMNTYKFEWARTGYALFMAYSALEYSGLTWSQLNYSYTTPIDYKDAIVRTIDKYLASSSANYNNTLGIGNGFYDPLYASPDAAGELFASFCFRLARDYGGQAFVKKLWKNLALRPNVVTDQDMVDNFFLASCASAGKNLTSVFQSWRWPVSQKAITEAAQYP